MTHPESKTERPEAAELDFLRRLHRRDGGTVQELCDEMSVTATAVRNRLTRLVSAGYVSKRLVRTGRGRPRHNYVVTDRGLRELGDNYSDLAAVLWNELRRIPDVAVRKSLLDRIQATLAERYGRGVDGTTLRTRISQFQRSLSESGLDVEIDESGDLPVLRENNCPYYDLAASDADICDLEQRVFEHVLRAPLELTHRCIEGHSCCTFRIGVERPIGEGTNADRNPQPNTIAFAHGED